MKPEERARVWIDNKLEASGWRIINRDEYQPRMSAVAIREMLLKGNHEADYLLMVNGKAAAVIEAKREEIELDSPKLIEQAEGYTKQLLPWCQTWEDPIKLVYLSNGREIAFKDAHDIGSAYKKISKFPTPKDLVKLLRIEDPFAGLPTLFRGSLRQCQFEAILNFEKSLRQGKKRALIVLATGAGKTYTACAIAYRMLAYTNVRRVLFLVDRNNLGVAALRAFGDFSVRGTNKKFSEIYGVEKMLSRGPAQRSRVVISTIQRLYSVLTGSAEEFDDEADDTGSLRGDEQIIELPEHPKLPKDFFDLIIIDECHRSIYSSWKAVLDYFDTAILLGMTATPIPESLSYFDNNVVVNYTLEKSITDGVNVPHRLYRIKTQLSEEGGKIDTGELVKVESKQTGKTKEVKSKEEQTFTKTELNRSVVVRDQIRQIIQEYKDIVYTKLYPDREPNFDFLPKTLIFAVSERHARDVVDVVKEVFGREDNKFVQRITYSAGDSSALIRSFNTDVDFRIAVTVTLVATGTDVRPLEVLIFLNDVRSETLYTQMKGRGVRTISNDQLRSVTPNASSKECFYLIDAVGVTESEKIVKGPSEGGSGGFNLSFEELFERMSHGYVPDEYIELLAGKLSVIGNRGDKDELAIFQELAGFTPQAFAATLYEALNNKTLPPFRDVNEDNAVRMELLNPLLGNAKARQKIVEISKGYIKSLENKKDEVIYSGFSQEEAKSSTAAFEKYVNEHKDEIEALRMIYAGEAGNLTPNDLKDLQKKITEALPDFNVAKLWSEYAICSPERVRKLSKSELEALTNLIQLVRFAYKQIEELCALPFLAAQRFELWCGQKQNEIPMTPDQKEVFRKVANYIAMNGAYTFRTIRVIDSELADCLIRMFGNAKAANEPILSLNAFMI